MVLARIEEAGVGGAEGRSSHDPIEHLGEDRLGRSDFALLLARALSEYPEARSMVVALYGDVGSGKTSTLNLCFEALENLPPEERPLVVRFEPWWFSNTGDLLAQFFARLGDDLEKKGKLKGIKRKMIRYGGMLAPALGGLADAFGGLGAGSAIGGWFSRLSKSSEEKAAQKAQDVHALRAEITKALAGFERRVVVVIDDIDRLSAVEIRDIFKVAKATADFPNTRYLLAFDRGIVTKALAEVQGTDGDAYLEKIVQVPFRLPEPAPGQLWALARRGMKEISAAQERVSEQDLAEASDTLDLLTHYGFGGFFGNMRQVNRLLDTLRLTLTFIAGEVRLSDLLVLETLRVVEPKVYDRMLEAQDLLLGPSPGTGLSFMARSSRDAAEELDGATKEEVEAIATEASDGMTGTVMRVLEHLFPRVGAAINRAAAYGPEFRHQWTHERRVCVPELFRIATSWVLPPSIIPYREVEELTAETDAVSLREKLLAYEEDQREGVDLEAALERAGAFYRTAADEPTLRTILLAVLGIEGVGTAHRVLYLLASDALGRLADSASRRDLLVNWIRSNGATPVLVDVLRESGFEHGWHRDAALPEDVSKLSSEDFRQVLDVAVPAIRAQADSGTLLSSDLFDEYLYLWGDAEGKDGPRQYLREVLETERGLPDLLRAYVTKTSSAFDGWVEDPDEDSPLRVQLLEDFGLVEETRIAAGRLLQQNAGNLSDDDRARLTAFELRYVSQEGDEDAGDAALEENGDRREEVAAPTGRDGDGTASALLTLAGSIPGEDLRRMEEAIEDGCERVEEEGW